MAEYIGDLMFSTGEYKNKDGEVKKSWSKAGAVFKNNGKVSIKFEAMPADPNWSGWMSIFMKDNDKQPANKEVVPTGNVENEEIRLDEIEIPF